MIRPTTLFKPILLGFGLFSAALPAMAQQPVQIESSMEVPATEESSNERKERMEYERKLIY